MRSIWSWCRQLNKQRWTYCLFTGDVSFTSVADIRYIIHTDNIEPSLNQFSITLYYRLGGGGGLRIPYGASGLLDETGMCETPPLLRIRKCSSISVKNKGYSLSFYRGGLQSVFYVVPYTVVIFGCRICYSPPFLSTIIERSVNLYTDPLLFIYCEIIFKNIVQSLADDVEIVIINPPTLLLHRLQLLHHHSRLLQKR